MRRTTWKWTSVILIGAGLGLLLAAGIWPSRSGSASGPSLSGPAAKLRAGGESSNPSDATAAAEQIRQPGGPPRRTAGSGAAEFYLQAFELYAHLSAEEKKMLSRPDEEVDAEAAELLFAKIQPIMALIRRAAAEETCDWGLGPARFGTPTPHIDKAYGLAYLAHWSAAYRFPEEPGEAVDDLIGQLAIQYHVAESAVGLVMLGGMEAMVTQLVRRNASHLDDAAFAKIEEMQAMNFLTRAAPRAFAGEAVAVRNSGERLSRMSDEEVSQMLSFTSAADTDASDIHQVLTDRTRLDAEIEWIAQVDERLGETLLWPEARFAAWWSGIEGQLTDARPLAKVTMPAMKAIHTSVQRVLALREMLGAAMAVMRRDEVQFQNRVDPRTGHPFSIIMLQDGFELSSESADAEKPLKMKFSTPTQ